MSRPVDRLDARLASQADQAELLIGAHAMLRRHADEAWARGDKAHSEHLHNRARSTIARVCGVLGEHKPVSLKVSNTYTGEHREWTQCEYCRVLL